MTAHPDPTPTARAVALIEGMWIGHGHLRQTIARSEAEEIVATLAAAGLLADPTTRTEELAKAWDKGHREGQRYWMLGRPNPYRTVTDWTPAEENEHG
jgi:hypothetical protein